MSVKGSSRVGVLGGFDKKLDDTVKERKTREEALSRKRKREEEEKENVFIFESVESAPGEMGMTDAFINDQDFNSFESTKKSERRKELIPRAAYLVASKYNLSSRALTELAAAFQGPEVDLTKFKLSQNSTIRKTKVIRRDESDK